MRTSFILRCITLLAKAHIMKRLEDAHSQQLSTSLIRWHRSTIVDGSIGRWRAAIGLLLLIDEKIIAIDCVVRNGFEQGSCLSRDWGQIRRFVGILSIETGWCEMKIIQTIAGNGERREWKWRETLRGRTMINHGIVGDCTSFQSVRWRLRLLKTTISMANRILLRCLRGQKWTAWQSTNIDIARNKINNMSVEINSKRCFCQASLLSLRLKGTVNRSGDSLVKSSFSQL